MQNFQVDKTKLLQRFDMKSILKYPGGKSRIAEWIISFFPQHKTYLEPYFGSGAVFFNKEPSYIETINDIDGNIVNLFTVCREYPKELSAAINLTPFSRDEFERCYDQSSDQIEQARRTLVRFHQSFGTCNASCNSWRNVQKHSGPRCATMWNYLPDLIVDCCQRLKNAQIEHYDALELIKRYDDENTLIYIDPPYLQELRKKNMYKYEYSLEQHKELLKVIKQSKSMIVISGYDNELYNAELAGWYSAEIETLAQMGKKRTEKIWFNYVVNTKIF